MPVKFRGASEYTSVYKWSPSFRSASFSPSKQQSLPDAGLRSDQFCILQEPGFTHKMAVPHRKSLASSCLIWESSLKEDDLDKSEFTKSKDPVVTKSKNLNTVVNEKFCQNSSKVVIKESKQIETEQIRDAEKENNQIKIVKPQLKETEKKSSVFTSKNSKTSKTSQPKPQAIPLRFRPKSMPTYVYPSCKSEYQVMFRKPKKSYPVAPALSALDIVHKSSCISPSKKIKFRHKTSYSVNYEKPVPIKKQVSPSPASPSLKLKVKNLNNIKSRNTKSAPITKSRSEYNTVYKEREFPLPEQSYLRLEASKNKSNRDGENFDKHHSVQLHSPDNKCWDLSTIVSSNAERDKLSSRIGSNKADSDVEQPNVVRKLEFDDVEESKHAENQEDPDSVKQSDCLESICDNSVVEEPKVVRKLDFNVEDGEINEDKEGDEKIKEVAETAETEVVKNVVTETSNEKTLLNDEASVEMQSVKTELSAASCSKTSATASTVLGRVPTPDIKMVGGALRTHHDITTPSKGGAILSSPSKNAVKNALLATKIKDSECAVVNEKKPLVVKKNYNELPRRMKEVVRAPIKGALRDQEFQAFTNDIRPLSALETLSIASARSSNALKDMLERSMQRQIGTK